MSAAAAGSKVLFAGGLDESLSKVVDIYDAVEKKWSSSILSEARSNIAAASNADKIVFAGGHTAHGLSDVVDIYDIRTAKWSTARLSEPRAPASVLTAGPFLFFDPGRIDGDIHSSVLDIYNTKTNQCSKLTLPGNRIRVISCSNNKLAVFAFGEDYLTGQATQLCLFDLQTGRSVFKALPAPFYSEFSMGVIGDYVLMAGGIRMGRYHRNVLAYDMGTDRIDSTTYRLPHVTWAASSALAGGKILFAGGLSFSAASSPTNHRTIGVFELK
jgi:hypothetical protein